MSAEQSRHCFDFFGKGPLGKGASHGKRVMYATEATSTGSDWGKRRAVSVAVGRKEGPWGQRTEAPHQTAKTGRDLHWPQLDLPTKSVAQAQRRAFRLFWDEEMRRTI